MVDRFHLDTDFLIFAVAEDGAERARLRDLAASEAIIEMSAIAWYEFCRGPRTPEQLAAARDLLGDEGVVPFTREASELAADQFRRLGSPRRRAADVAIGLTAAQREAVLLSGNQRDFAGVDGLRVEGPERRRGGGC